MKKLLLLSLSVISLLLASCASTDQGAPQAKKSPVKARIPFKGDIVNAGIVFSTPNGGEAGVAKVFPFSWAEVKSKSLNKVLAEKIATVKKDGCNFITDDLASVKDGAISMAFVVDAERCFVSYISGIKKYKLEVFIVSEVVFFDFKKKSILASYPFMVSYAQNYDKVPTDADKKAIMGKIFSSEPQIENGVDVNVFSHFINTLKGIKIYNTFNSTIGVTSVSISKDAKNSMDRIGFADPNAASSFAANMFNNSIYNAYNTPVLPFSYNNSELFYVMADSYKEGNQLSNELLLKVPTPTYKINLDLSKFFTKLAKQEGQVQVHTFASVYAINVKDIENQPVFNKKIAKTTKATFTSEYGDKDLFTAELFYNFISLNKSIGPRLKTDKKFREFNDIMYYCQ